jgi:hypothetical protein
MAFRFPIAKECADGCCPGPPPCCDFCYDGAKQSAPSEMTVQLGSGSGIATCDWIGGLYTLKLCCPGGPVCQQTAFYPTAPNGPVTQCQWTGTFPLADYLGYPVDLELTLSASFYNDAANSYSFNQVQLDVFTHSEAWAVANSTNCHAVGGVAGYLVMYRTGLPLPQCSNYFPPCGFGFSTYPPGTPPSNQCSQYSALALYEVQTWDYMTTNTNGPPYYCGQPQDINACKFPTTITVSAG